MLCTIKTKGVATKTDVTMINAHKQKSLGSGEEQKISITGSSGSYKEAVGLV